MKKNVSLGLVLVLLALSFMGLKVRLEQIPRPRVPGSSIIYLPSGKYLKMTTFGYSSLAADLIYIWAIQYYGNTAVTDRFAYFNRIFDVISELDPKYVDPYEVGALIAIDDLQDIPLAIKILDLGLSKNPDQWIFPLEAGHYAQMYAKDHELAKTYFKKAMDIPGAPDVAKRLYAAASFQTSDLKTAWETWLEVYQTAPDDQIRKIASNHLYEVKAAMDTAALKGALEKYRERFRRNPVELEQLVRAGLLASLPRDLDGKDYLYDPQTGEIKTSVSPWKR
jgi:tetratricopeptide (TPR) repeat protein